MVLHDARLEVDQNRKKKTVSLSVSEQRASCVQSTGEKPINRRFHSRVSFHMDRTHHLRRPRPRNIPSFESAIRSWQPMSRQCSPRSPALCQSSSKRRTCYSNSQQGKTALPATPHKHSNTHLLGRISSPSCAPFTASSASRFTRTSDDGTVHVLLGPTVCSWTDASMCFRHVRDFLRCTAVSLSASGSQPQALFLHSRSEDHTPLPCNASDAVSRLLVVRRTERQNGIEVL